MNDLKIPIPDWAFLKWKYFDNTVQSWIVAAAVFVVLWLVLRIIKGIVAHRYKKKAREEGTHWVMLVGVLIRKVNFLLVTVWALYAASSFLTVPEAFHVWARTISIIAFLIQVAIWGDAALAFWLERYSQLHIKEDASRVTIVRAATFVGRLVFYGVITLIALNNIPNFEVTTLIASLGVGGIAVALAVQSILADLFASLTISLDQPFVIGDFIIVGDFMGSVEHIGLKTTRIRSLSGEQIVFSNNDLLSSRIRNYKRMYERRVVFSIGVTYDTPYEKVQAIPGMIRQYIEAEDKTRFDRDNFSSYGDSALNFEVVYFVQDPDYNLYMNIQEAINLAIFKRFEEEGIEFAFPTRTLHIASQAAPVASGN